MPKTTCSVDGCDRPSKARGWCHRHYMRWYQTGSVELPERLDACMQCGAPIEFTSGHYGSTKRYCSRVCGSRASYLRRRDAINARRRAEHVPKPASARACEQCGESFWSRRDDARFCSRRCVNRYHRTHPDGSCTTEGCGGTAIARGLCSPCYKRLSRAEGRMKSPAWTPERKATQQRRRAQRKMLPADLIRVVEVYERDGWVCGLCGGRVDPESAYPDPLSPSLDHVVPLSKGGHHVLSNVQLAHLSCNVRKGDRHEAVALSR